MSSFLITPSLGSAVVSAEDSARDMRDFLLKKAVFVTTVTDRIDADEHFVALRLANLDGGQFRGRTRVKQHRGTCVDHSRMVRPGNLRPMTGIDTCQEHR